MLVCGGDDCGDGVPGCMSGYSGEGRDDTYWKVSVLSLTRGSHDDVRMPE